MENQSEDVAAGECQRQILHRSRRRPGVGSNSSACSADPGEITAIFAVLPSGAANVRKLQSVLVEAGGKKQTATLYEIGGLAFTPNYLWLDEQQQLIASVSGWFSVARQGFESTVPSLRESQRQVEPREQRNWQRN